MSASDEDIVRWAAEQGRVLISRDARTLEHAVVALIESSGTSAGFGLLRKGMSMAETVEILRLIAVATERHEWQNAILWFP